MRVLRALKVLSAAALFWNSSLFAQDISMEIRTKELSYELGAKTLTPGKSGSVAKTTNTRALTTPTTVSYHGRLGKTVLNVVPSGSLLRAGAGYKVLDALETGLDLALDFERTKVGDETTTTTNTHTLVPYGIYTLDLGSGSKLKALVELKYKTGSTPTTTTSGWGTTLGAVFLYALTEQISYTAGLVYGMASTSVTQASVTDKTTQWNLAFNLAAFRFYL